MSERNTPHPEQPDKTPTDGDLDELDVPITVDISSSVPPPEEASQVTRVDEEVVRRAEQSVLVASRPSDRPKRKSDGKKQEDGGGKSRYAGRYELVGLLGVGGMGSVYRVRDLILDEEVALKILRKDLADSPKAVARFRKEVKLTRRITHPNVVRIYDIDRMGQEHFYTMECILGEVLSTLLSQEGQMPVSRTLELGIQLVDGVKAIHTAHIIHRDLKPDNVLVSREGRVVITDFGVAVLEDDPQADVLPMRGAGTPRYMAPEQIEGRHLSQQTDIYALGLILYEMLTGRLPWSESEEGAGMARLSVPATNPQQFAPDTPDSLAKSILMALEREPEQRHSSVGELLEQLQSVRRELEQGTSSSGGSQPRRSLRPRSRKDMPAIATTNTPHQRSIGVLPFKNLGNPSDNYIAQAMTTALIENLILCPAVRVAKRFELGMHADSPESLVLAGKQAAVDVVVEGAINRHASGRMFVTVRAIEVERGFILWSERFQRPTNKMFELQHEVAVALAEVLTLEYSGEQREQGPSNPENVDVFVKAQEAYGSWTVEGLKRSLRWLEEAHARSPDDALIESYLALVQLRLWELTPTADHQLAESSEKLARKVIEAHPNVGEAHLAVGIHDFYDAHWISAARRLEESVRCNPALADAHWMLGRLRGMTGDTQEAKAMLDVALRINPQHLGALWDIAYVTGFAGELSWSRDSLSRAEEIQPGHPSTVVAMARIGAWTGDELMKASARDHYERMNPAYFPTMGMVASLLLEPHPDSFVEQLTTVAATPSTPAAAKCFLMQVIAERMAQLGRADEAWLGVRASSTYSVDIAWFTSCPMLEKMGRPAVLRSLQSHVRARAKRIFEERKQQD